MQRQFTIELRVDYADPDKNEVMRAALQAAGRHVYATALLLKDQVTPQIAIFSDDFFTGHAQIELLTDTIQAGRDELAAAGSSEEEPVSSELMQVFKDKAADDAQKKA